MKRAIVLYVLVLLTWVISAGSVYIAYGHFIGATNLSPVLSGVFGTLHIIMAVYAFYWPIREIIKDGWPHKW